MLQREEEAEAILGGMGGSTDAPERAGGSELAWGINVCGPGNHRPVALAEALGVEIPELEQMHLGARPCGIASCPKCAIRVKVAKALRDCIEAVKTTWKKKLCPAGAQYEWVEEFDSRWVIRNRSRFVFTLRLRGEAVDHIVEHAVANLISLEGRRRDAHKCPMCLSIESLIGAIGDEVGRLRGEQETHYLQCKRPPTSPRSAVVLKGQSGRSIGGLCFPSVSARPNGEKL